VSDIVVIGSLNMDLVVKTERMPSPGETLAGSGFRTIPGGKGANQAAAMARLGGRVSMVGRVGADAFGRELVDNLAAQGVDTRHVRADSEAPTGIAMIVVDRDGENSIILAPGANGRVSRADVDAGEGLIREAQAVVLQFEIPLEAVAYAMEVAARHAVPVVLNPAPAYPISGDLLSRVSYLILNESEARLLTGVQVQDVASGYHAASLLRDRGVGVVILTLGERGALLVVETSTGGGQRHIPTRSVNVVDTTAAGDAFVGGFCISLIQRLDLEAAVRFAAAAGTLAVTRFGAQTSLPDRAEVQAFLAR
jgi:ribokinase